MTLPRQRTDYRVTFAVITAGVAAYALLQSLVTPVLPTIQHDLHTSQTTVTWVLTAYLLSASVFTPIMGRLGDMIGKERMLVVCLLGLSAGSILAAIAPSIGVLIIARAIQGIGGGVVPLAFGIVRDEFPAERVTSAVGVVAAVTAGGAGLGIVLAGPIVQVFNYHWLFWIPAVMTAGAAIASHVFVPESPSKSHGKISWLAAVTLSGWLVALLVAVSEAPVWGWGSASVIGLLVLAMALAAAWVYVELHSASPLIDMRMMRIPAVWTVNLVALLFGIGMYSAFAFLPEFLQTPKSSGYGFGLSITQSGLILLPLNVFMFLLGIASGPLTHRFGAKAVLLAGSAVSVVAFLMLTYVHGSLWEILLAGSIMGMGFAMAFAAMAGIVVSAVPAAQTGVASGMNANIRTIGGGIGAAIMASIVTSGASADGLPKESGYTHGFLFLAMAAILACIAALAVPKMRGDRDLPELPHPEMALVAGGTLSGDQSE